MVNPVQLKKHLIKSAYVLYSWLLQVRAIAEMINSGIQPLQNLRVLNKVGDWCGDNDKKAEWAKFWIHKGFEGMYPEA